MRIAFWKKSPPKPSDFEVMIADFQKRQTAQQQEMKELCFLVGRTLFMCELVESQIHGILNHMVGSYVDFGKWWETGKLPPKLYKGIAELQKRFNISRDFVDNLERFRIARNKFAHDLWNVSKHNLMSDDGRKETAQFVIELSEEGKALNNILWPALKEHYERVLGRTDN